MLYFLLINLMFRVKELSGMLRKWLKVATSIRTSSNCKLQKSNNSV